MEIYDFNFSLSFLKNYPFIGYVINKHIYQTFVFYLHTQIYIFVIRYVVWFRLLQVFIWRIWNFCSLNPYNKQEHEQIYLKCFNDNFIFIIYLDRIIFIFIVIFKKILKIGKYNFTTYLINYVYNFKPILWF